MRPALLLPAAMLFLIAACATPTQPSASPTTPPATPAPSVAPTPEPSEAPASPPATDDPGSTPAPSDSEAPTMTPEEAALIDSLRVDAGVDCTPRRTGLPEGALYGIECRPDSSLVARVGIYRFASGNEAAYAYMNRMAEAGVDVRAGNCALDVPGEGAWTPGDGEGSIDDPGVFNFENEVLSPERIGCFLDENGIANVRATCGLDYIGILGREKDLSKLTDWAWLYPEGYEVGTPDPPGICIGKAVQG